MKELLGKNGKLFGLVRDGQWSIRAIRYFLELSTIHSAAFAAGFLEV